MKNTLSWLILCLLGSVLLSRLNIQDAPLAHYPPVRLSEVFATLAQEPGYQLPTLTICGISPEMEPDAVKRRLPWGSPGADDKWGYTFGDSNVKYQFGAGCRVTGNQLERKGQVLALADGRLRLSQLKSLLGQPESIEPGGAQVRVGIELVYVSFKKEWLSSADPVIQGFTMRIS